MKHHRPGATDIAAEIVAQRLDAFEGTRLAIGANAGFLWKSQLLYMTAS
jgi:hypothetical protein